MDQETAGWEVASAVLQDVYLVRHLIACHWDNWPKLVLVNKAFWQAYTFEEVVKIAVIWAETPYKFEWSNLFFEWYWREPWRFSKLTS